MRCNRFVGILSIGFLLFALSHHRAGSGGHGHGHRRWASRMGPGGPGGFGGPTDPSDRRHQWVAELHRSLHAEDVSLDRPAGGTPAA